MKIAVTENGNRVIEVSMFELLIDFKQNDVSFTCHLFEKQLDDYGNLVRWTVTDTLEMFHCMYPEVFNNAIFSELKGAVMSKIWFTPEWKERWNLIYRNNGSNKQRRISLFTEILKQYGSRTGVMREFFGEKQFVLKN